jgi:hypothetical protein
VLEEEEAEGEKNKKKVSLLCSQQRATGAYPEPVDSSAYSPILFFFKIHFNIIVLSTSTSLSLRGPSKILYALLFAPILATCPTPSS